MVELHKNKAKITYEQALFYPLTSAFIYKKGRRNLFYGGGLNKNVGHHG